MSSPRLCQLDAGRRRGHQDSDSTESVYGRDVTFKAVVQGKVATPEIAREFMKAVRETAHKTKVQEARDGGEVAKDLHSKGCASQANAPVQP